MPRIARADWPGSWHHVMNRAIARRTLFERREDFRYFIAAVACAVRRGEIELHAFCLMGTHYHLLLRSLLGELGSAMQRIQLAYSRWFNRSRRRDGSLVRGRFSSKPVESLSYRRALVRYIDSNPCRAGIVRHPAEYPYGSASHYARTSGPPWLERNWIERTVLLETDTQQYDPSDYHQTFGELSDELVEIVEARLSRGSGPDPLDNLVTASPDQVRGWMVRKARLADGTTPNSPIIALSRLEEVIEAERNEAWTIQHGRVQRSAWPVALAGLGRELCGASLTRLTEHLEVSNSTVSKLCRLHDQEMQRGGEYSVRSARLAHVALQGWGGV